MEIRMHVVHMFRVMVLLGGTALPPLPVSAEDFEADDWLSRKGQILIQAKELKQMESSLEDIETERVEKELCRLQLSLRKIPESCFSWLEREKRAGTSPGEDEAKKLEELEEFCVQVVRERDLSTSGYPEGALPEKSRCRREMEEWKKRKDYVLKGHNNRVWDVLRH